MLDWFWLTLAAKIGGERRHRRHGFIPGGTLRSFSRSDDRHIADLGGSRLCRARAGAWTGLHRAKQSRKPLRQCRRRFCSSRFMRGSLHIMARWRASAICFALWIACATAITRLSPPLSGVLALERRRFHDRLHRSAAWHTREGVAPRKPAPRWWDVPARALASWESS